MTKSIGEAFLDGECRKLTELNYPPDNLRTIEEVCGGKPCVAAHGFAEWPEAPPCKMRKGHGGQHENGCFSWDTDAIEQKMAALDDVPGSGT